MYIYKRKIQYYETDKMGIVHHSNYLRFFEEARLEYMAVKNLPYTKMEEMGVMIPVTSADLKFRKPATFGDTIEIYSKTEIYNGVRLSVNYEAYRENELLITGNTEHTFLNKDFKIIRLNKDFPEFHKIFMSMLEEK